MIRYSYDTINYNLSVPAPAPPSAENWLGTDDQGQRRDGPLDLRLSHLSLIWTLSDHLLVRSLA